MSAFLSAGPLTRLPRKDNRVTSLNHLNALSASGPAESAVDFVIKADDVHVSFGQTPALRGGSVAAAAGEFLAVMGPSGSGKSTLLHCLAGIITPDSGSIWYGDKRLDRLSAKQRTTLRRTEFGFVFQFGQLVPELSAADNIAVPLLLNRVNRAAAYRQAHTWLSRLGLDALSARRTGELSGGQAQRVAIARALAIGPRVLFADEPTGSLDSQTGKEVLDLLVNLVRAEGTTVILVTHDVNVAGYADRTVQVSDGTVHAMPMAGEV
jgi:putative ABC transport system ATP-binding protein